MNSDFFSRIPLVEILTKQCFSFWRDFSENDWKKQTYCEGWSPEDIVSHLVTGTEFYSYSIERAINNLLPIPCRPRGFTAKITPIKVMPISKKGVARIECQ